MSGLTERCLGGRLHEHFYSQEAEQPKKSEWGSLCRSRRGNGVEAHERPVEAQSTVRPSNTVQRSQKIEGERSRHNTRDAPRNYLKVLVIARRSFGRAGGGVRVKRGECDEADGEVPPTL